jgi:hypothetical protein
MGQAKQRGSKEERVHAAIELKQEAERKAKVAREEREAKRAEKRTKDIVVISEGKRTSISPITRRMLGVALASMAGIGQVGFIDNRD